MDNRIVATKEQAEELRFWQNVMKLNTSIPAIIDDFDIGTQRVSAIPAIQAMCKNPDGTVYYINYPKITNIPLAIQKGLGISITYPIQKGKLCTLIFSQRSIDNLLFESSKPVNPFIGGPAYTSSLRCMDMTDAMCFPGIITNQEAIQNYNNNAVEIRNEDASVKISISQNDLTMEQEGASIKLSGGNVEIVGTSVTINGKDFDTHMHSGVTSGGSNTGGVV